MRFFANAQNDGGAYGDEILHPKGFRMTAAVLLLNQPDLRNKVQSARIYLHPQNDGVWQHNKKVGKNPTFLYPLVLFIL